MWGRDLKEAQGFSRSLDQLNKCSCVLHNKLMLSSCLSVIHLVRVVRVSNGCHAHNFVVFVANNYMTPIIVQYRSLGVVSTLFLPLFLALSLAAKSG